MLDSLRFRHLDEDIFYWRNKAGREVDFVVRRGRGRVDTFEDLPHWTRIPDSGG